MWLEISEVAVDSTLLKIKGNLHTFKLLIKQNNLIYSIDGKEYKLDMSLKASSYFYFSHELNGEKGQIHV